MRAALLTAAVCLLACASEASADWIVFTSGAATPVAAIELQGDRVRLTRPDGGWVTAPADRIDWDASAARSGHRVRPDPGAVRHADPTNGGAQTEVRRTKAGAPFPAADPDGYRAFAVRVAPPPKIDGALDDEAWQRAMPFGGFYQEERREGEPESEHTEIRIVYDDEAIYFAVRAYDREPDKVVAMNMLREATLRTDDSIRILLDPLHDHRTAFLFGTNANGIIVDAYLFGRTEANMNRDWNGVWWTRGRRDAQGWTSEVAIPFKTLKFPNNDIQTWGLTVSRRVARRNEFSYWPFIPNDSTFYWAGSAGHLEGLSHITPGRNLQWKPYVSGGAERNVTLARPTKQFDAGFDFKYGFTPNLTADFTYHTDFAQTEVDDIQVNLTRFPTYYQEKRQYFLEGARIFDFGLRQQAEIFYSRRIGLTESGSAVPILVGSRLNGKQGRYYIGALNIQTQNTEGEGGQLVAPSTNWTVVRLSRDFLRRSRVGMIFTNRTAVGETVSDNRVVGVDTTLYRGNAFNFDGFVAAVWDPAIEDDRLAGRAAMVYDTDKYGVSASYLDVADNFKPAVGFVSRRGIRRVSASARFSPRPRVMNVRRLFLEPRLDYFTRHDGTPESRDRALQVRPEFDSGESLSVNVGDNLENLFRPFTIRPGVVIAPGTYRFTESTLAVSSYPGRPLSGTVNVSQGGFYDGEKTSLLLTGSWRVNPHLSLAPSYSVNRVSLAGAAFTTHLVRNRFNYNFSSLLSLNALVQWSNDTRSFVTNLRLNWIYRPGTDFYLVYTEIDDTRGEFSPRNRTLIAKVNYIVDF